MMAIWAIRPSFQKTFIFFQTINDAIQKRTNCQSKKKDKKIKKQS
jgi:hypothetical protein